MSITFFVFFYLCYFPFYSCICIYSLLLFSFSTLPLHVHFIYLKLRITKCRAKAIGTYICMYMSINECRKEESLDLSVGTSHTSSTLPTGVLVSSSVRITSMKLIRRRSAIHVTDS